MLQNAKDDKATLLLSTHECKEIDIKNSLEEISKLSYIESYPAMIRIL